MSSESNQSSVITINAAVVAYAAEGDAVINNARGVLQQSAKRVIHRGGVEAKPTEVKALDEKTTLIDRMIDLQNLTPEQLLEAKKYFHIIRDELKKTEKPSPSRITGALRKLRMISPAMLTTIVPIFADPLVQRIFANVGLKFGNVAQTIQTLRNHAPV